MNKTLLCFFVLSLCLFVSVNSVRADVFPSYVRVTQEASSDSFDGSFADGTGAAIRFLLNDAADSVVVKIIPAAGGAAVKTFVLTNATAGDTLIIWNGSSDTGPTVPAPVDDYLIELTAYAAGVSSYTVFFNDYPAIYTRGVAPVTNPALRMFGWIYSVSNGGYVTGAARHSADGAQWGDTFGDAFLTTTGQALGPGNLRYGTIVDEDGYVWVARYDPDELYRFHVDTLNVTRVDSSETIAFNRLIGLDVVGTGSSKVLYLTGRDYIARMAIGDASTFTGTLDTIVIADTSVMGSGSDIWLWSAVVSEQGYMYVSFQDTPDSAWRGVSMYDLNTMTGPMTFADTVWTHFFTDGDPVTLALWDGPTSAIDDDILYLSMDRAGAAVDTSGIYELTNLSLSNSPTVKLIWEDYENNASSYRSTVGLDVVGNLIYFENSNEHTTLISPPNGANSYTYTFIDTIGVTGTGVLVGTLLNIAVAREDLDSDYVPDRLGDTVRVIGVVNSVNFQTSNVSYGLQDATGGITLFYRGQVGTPIKFGDLVQVTGFIDQYAGLTEITPFDSVTNVMVLDTAQTITAPELTIGEFLADPEKYESMRIKLSVAAPLFDAADWPAAGSDGYLDIWDGVDELLMRIDKDTEIDGSTMPTFPVELYGTTTQYDASPPPADVGYQIQPSYITDFVGPIQTPPLAYFELLTPTDGDIVVLHDVAQVVSFSWRPAIDFNGDVLKYNWTPIGFPSGLSDNLGADTVKTMTGADLLAYLGSADWVTFKWTVQAMDTPPPVSNTDTSTVTVVRGRIQGVADDISIPKEFYLRQNYPNPFNPSTTISYGLPNGVHVRLDVFNVLGQKVSTLVDTEQHPGRYRVIFNSGRVASGVYFYILTAGDRVFKKKMLILK